MISSVPEIKNVSKYEQKSPQRNKCYSLIIGKRIQHVISINLNSYRLPQDRIALQKCNKWLCPISNLVESTRDLTARIENFKDDLERMILKGL